MYKSAALLGLLAVFGTGLESQFGPVWPCSQRRDAQNPALPGQVPMSSLPLSFSACGRAVLLKPLEDIVPTDGLGDRLQPLLHGEDFNVIRRS